jgi:hypothetical protein
MKKTPPSVINDSDSKLVALASLYDIIFGEELSDGPKIYIGNQTSESRQCRFCGKTSSETSFRNVAHAIPESLGNKRLISLEECDECNTYFSKELDDSLAKYLQPYRTLFFIKGKKGPPSYKTDDKTARIDPVDGRLRISGEEEKVFSKGQNGDLEMFLHRQPYRPLSVFKAFVKIALSILPSEEDIETLTPVKRWIRTPDSSRHFPGPHIISERFLPGRGRSVKGSTLFEFISLCCQNQISKIDLLNGGILLMARKLSKHCFKS